VQLVKRADDNVETVRARIATFEEQTRPLIDYYRAAGLLRTVDGTRTPEAIFDDIEKIVRE
jgi:adenylate kinase